MVSLPGLRSRKVVPARTAGELDAMAAAGAVVADALRAVREAAGPGVSTKDLDDVAET
ncbi:MAG TPA: type I methionyl aminopeptidase, partial [Mycobacterium sp.]|nr:type I methionyl aminopeptidase [Mycobacterium sp.]